MADKPIILIVKDRAGNKTRQRFHGWPAANEYIRSVILGQIVDEIANHALQENPSAFKEEIEELQEIAHDINYPRNAEELKDAVERWTEYTDKATGFTWIEFP